MKRASLRDIASKSGVSLKTVSRILRGEVENHRPDTCELVKSVAERMNYRPNLAAGAVFGRQTRTVGIMIPFSYEADFFGRIVKGAHDELIKRNYAPILIFSTPELGLREQIHRLIDRQVDGILVRPMYETVDDILLEEVLGRNLPLVIVLRPTKMQGKLDFVGSDDRHNGAMAARHLLELGHRQAAFLAVDYTAELLTDSISGQRWEGFRDAFAAAGGETRLCYRERTGADVKAMSAELLKSIPRPTAIFAMNDRMALDVYAAAQECGLRIPRDLSVVGCGNLDYSPHVTPPLTTVDQHPGRIGAEAAVRLIARIERKNGPPEELRLPGTLIARESAAAPGTP